MSQIDIRLKCNSVIAALFVSLAAGPLGLITVDDSPDSIDPKHVRVLSGGRARELCWFVAFEDGHGGTQLSMVQRSVRRADDDAINALIAGIEAQAKWARYFRGPFGFRPPGQESETAASEAIGSVSLT
jgi:hypothetical protein